MQQKITILNKRQEKLVGVLHETGSAKIVILCHGAGYTKDWKTLVNLAAVLENNEISAFRFDFSGNGESEGVVQFDNYSSEAEDLRSVVEYFNGLNRATVVVLGHSKGGNDVILYASKYHDIPAVINVSGHYDLIRFLELLLGKNCVEKLEKDGYVDVATETGVRRFTKEEVMETLTTDMNAVCRSIDERCKVLTILGSADEYIPVEDALEFSKVIKNHILKIIEGANHLFTLHQVELVSAILPFIKECMEQADVSQ